MSKMKRVINILLMLLVCVAVNAQEPAKSWTRPNPSWQTPDNRKQFSPELYMKKFSEFITREAHLTDSESERFLPLLKEMQEKQHAVMERNRRFFFRNHKGNTNISEKEYEEMVSQMTANEVEVKKIEQAYTKKFHTVLSWKKVFAVKMALNRWQMEVLNHFRPEKKDKQSFRPSWDDRK